MATDGLSIYATIQEFQILIGAKIDKITQPNKDILLLYVHGPECGRHRILININNENGRIQLTKRNFENPEKAPSFCMLLRKYLIGAHIISISQPQLNRIVCFSIRGKNELRDDIFLFLIVELMGRHGNVFLINSEDMILDCMRHFGPSDESIRICLPNCRYENPPMQDKYSPFSLTETELSTLAQGRPPRDWLGNEVLGISKLCAQQICTPDISPDKIGSACFEVFQDLSKGRFTPSVIPEKGVLPFCPKNAPFQAYPTMSEAQESFYQMRDDNMILSGQKIKMASVISRNMKRLSKKMELFISEVSDENRIERDRIYGELLLANLNSIRTVDKDAVVLDYYANPPQEIRIPLDRRFTVQQNAQRYFRTYRKLKNASEYAASQIDALRNELDYLESLQMSLESALAFDEIKEIQDEMEVQGYLKQELKKQNRKQKHVNFSPIMYRSSDGTIIKVGKNNLQNDYLLKTEHPDHIWLHTQKTPSSHVYIESAEPSRETLILAAEITALHSRAATSSRVPVDYTRKKDVKKPSGARPGFVLYYNQHTVFVTPKADKLNDYRI